MNRKQNKKPLFKRLTHGFYEMVDLSTNLDNGLTMIRGMQGISALVLGSALLLIVLGLLPLVWFLDIDSTRWATEQAIKVMLPKLPSELMLLASVISVCISLLPSVIELFGSRFAIAIKLAGWLVFSTALFDMVTDAPRVRMLMKAYWPAFEAMPWGSGWLLYWVLHLPFLFLASFGFELILIVFSIIGGVLLVNAFHADAD